MPPRNDDFAAQFVDNVEAAVHVVSPLPASRVQVLQASRNRRVFLLRPRRADTWQFIVGASGGMGTAAIAAGSIASGGWREMLSMSFVICAAIVVACGWLTSRWLRKVNSSYIVVVSSEQLDLIQRFGSRSRVRSIAVDGGSFATLRPVWTRDDDERAFHKRVISAEIVIETGEHRRAFGRGLTLSEQGWLVARINEFLGTGYAGCCPDCGTHLTPGDVDLESQRLSCPACAWGWEPRFELSADPRVEVIAEAPGTLVLEIAPGRPQIARARNVAIAVGVVTLGVAYITVHVLARVVANVGVATQALAFWGSVLLLLLLIFGKCYRGWRKSQDTVTRLELTPDNLALDKAVRGRLQEKDVSLGPHSSASVIGTGDQPTIAIRGAVQTFQIDEGLTHREAHAVANRINRFLGRPVWAPQLEFPDACPNCHRQFSAADVELASGQLQCDICAWSNDPARPTRLPESLGELVGLVRSQMQILGKLSEQDIPRHADFEESLRAGQRRGTASDSAARQVKQTVAQFEGLRKLLGPAQTLPWYPPKESAAPLADLRNAGALVEEVSIRHLRIDLPNGVSLRGNRQPLILFCLALIVMAVFRLGVWWGQWPGAFGWLILASGVAGAVFGTWLLLGSIRFDIDDDRIACFYHLGRVGYRRTVRCNDLEWVGLRSMLGMAEMLEIRGTSRRIMVAFTTQPNLVHYLHRAIRRHLSSLNIEIERRSPGTLRVPLD